MEGLRLELIVYSYREFFLGRRIGYFVGVFYIFRIGEIAGSWILGLFWVSEYYMFIVFYNLFE